eukprot:TRINITY_DN11881_c1_g3_i2.p1 TRINITY_DN11881_c1_g3~~TRINITY_DN11881_c1_g3_i2.p1  ORF type:complete len:289 (-),score=83.05 TRINITY_DN11881_c1_g3_i2:490-1356(-)
MRGPGGRFLPRRSASVGGNAPGSGRRQPAKERSEGWQAVVHALDELQTRQAAVRAEIGYLKRVSDVRRQSLEDNAAKWQEELAGLRAAQKASEIQYRRQSAALVSKTVAASQQAKRARSSLSKARHAIKATNTLVDEKSSQLEGALSALAGRSEEAKRLRSRVAALERQLQETDSGLRQKDTFAHRQEELLDAAAMALRAQLGVTEADVEKLRRQAAAEAAAAAAASAGSGSAARSEASPSRGSYSSDRDSSRRSSRSSPRSSRSQTYSSAHDSRSDSGSSRSSRSRE